MEHAGATWIEAFERMSLDHGHAWRRHTDPEIDWILGHTTLPDGARVLDVGCGDGRHVEGFCARDLDAIGVDIAPGLIARARLARPDMASRFIVCDARTEVPGHDLDLVTCLYDVIGASASKADDTGLLTLLVAALRPGGVLIGSVMNADATLGLLPEAHRPSTSAGLEAALAGLPASRTMEQTGCVFDPELLVAYEGIFHRKERFIDDGDPIEYLLRDRRFTVAELTVMLERSGLEVVAVFPVQAGRWGLEPALAADAPQAKELLFIARRSA